MHPYDTRYQGLYETRYDDPADRVLHLVFVDGRLVDTWREPAVGTRWEAVAVRHDREALPPAPPPKPSHEQVLDWLVDVCGGRPAVDALTADPLTDDAIDLPTEYAERHCRERMESTAELLDAVAERWFDTESSFAFRHALLALWGEDPDTVSRAASAAHLAGGIGWAVGKANGHFHPLGPLRVGRVQEALALRPSISVYGGSVRDVLRGFRGRSLDRWGRPAGVPDLLPLGRPELLLGATRDRLVRIRERARDAARAA